jgi:hypothetical protein
MTEAAILVTWPYSRLVQVSVSLHPPKEDRFSCVQASFYSCAVTGRPLPDSITCVVGACAVAMRAVTSLHALPPAHAALFAILGHCSLQGRRAHAHGMQEGKPHRQHPGESSGAMALLHHADIVQQFKTLQHTGCSPAACCASLQ